MQYTDNEAALIGGLISNYFFQPSVDAKLRESLLMVGKEAGTNLKAGHPPIPKIIKIQHEPEAGFSASGSPFTLRCFLYNHIFH